MRIMDGEVEQIFCKKCVGLETLIVNDKVIDPKDWMKHGMASDVGCICDPKIKRNNTKILNKKIENKLLNIAIRNLGFETLTPRNLDRLDFREVSCWNVHRALQEAFEAGQKSERE